MVYTDDALILTWGSARSQLEKNSKYAFNQSEDWVSNNDIEISIHKNQTITFSKHNIKGALKKNLKNRPPVIKINNINLKSVKEINYLGVLIDRSKSLLSHLSIYEEVHCQICFYSTPKIQMLHENINPS